jgi:uncharacterized protein YqjF (DUF2071 family)
MKHTPWIMAQTWADLLFAHWPVPPEQLLRLVQAPLQLDTFDGRAWVGVVAFRISDLHLRGLPPVPTLSGFPEVNLRTYVRLGNRPGVLFLSLQCANRLGMAIARPWFRLPYRFADVQLTRQSGQVHFTSRSPEQADFTAVYSPTSTAHALAPGSLEAWLTERYCYFAQCGSRGIFRCDIAHAPWRLAPARAHISRNSLPLMFNLRLPECQPLLHYAAHVQTRIWPLVRVCEALTSASAAGAAWSRVLV